MNCHLDYVHYCYLGTSRRRRYCIRKALCLCLVLDEIAPWNQVIFNIINYQVRYFVNTSSNIFSSAMLFLRPSSPSLSQNLFKVNHPTKPQSLVSVFLPSLSAHEVFLAEMVGFDVFISVYTTTLALILRCSMIDMSRQAPGHSEEQS